MQGLRDPKRDTANTDNIDLGADPGGVGRGNEAGLKNKPEAEGATARSQTRSREQQGVEEGSHLPAEHAPQDPRNRTSQVGEDPDNMLL